MRKDFHANKITFYEKEMHRDTRKSGKNKRKYPNKENPGTHSYWIKSAAGEDLTDNSLTVITPTTSYKRGK